MTPRERAEELWEDLQYLENDKSACLALIEQALGNQTSTVTDIHTIGREHDLREAREVAERNAADCSHLRQSAISLAAERDAERQRADAAEHQAKCDRAFADNWQKRFEEEYGKRAAAERERDEALSLQADTVQHLIQRDRRIAELEADVEAWRKQATLAEKFLGVSEARAAELEGKTVPVGSALRPDGTWDVPAPASPATAPDTVDKTAADVETIGHASPATATKLPEPLERIVKQYEIAQRPDETDAEFLKRVKDSGYLDSHSKEPK